MQSVQGSEERTNTRCRRRREALPAGRQGRERAGRRMQQRARYHLTKHPRSRPRGGPTQQLAPDTSRPAGCSTAASGRSHHPQGHLPAVGQLAVAS